MAKPRYTRAGRMLYDRGRPILLLERELDGDCLTPAGAVCILKECAQQMREGRNPRPRQRRRHEP